MEADERALFEAAIRRATDTCTDTALDAALRDLGWRDGLAADPSIAVSVLFEGQGAANAASSALDQVLATALGFEGAAVVLPPLRAVEAPGLLAAGRCAVRGLGSGALARSDTTVVVAASGGGHTARTVETAALQLRTVRGLDPALGLVEVSGDVDAGPATQREPVDWERALTLGQLALGHELVGVARAMLDLARHHAVERVQFGRPISSFQAIRHRLAESLVAVEAAAGLLDAVWDDPTPAMGAMAKGLAGRSGHTVARHAQQVLAGIGFTAEHPLHRSVRRTIVLDQLLGAGSALTRQVGTGIVERGTLPPALVL